MVSFKKDWSCKNLKSTNVAKKLHDQEFEQLLMRTKVSDAYLGLKSETGFIQISWCFVSWYCSFLPLNAKQTRKSSVVWTIYVCNIIVID